MSIARLLIVCLAVSAFQSIATAQSGSRTRGSGTVQQGSGSVRSSGTVMRGSGSIQGSGAKSAVAMNGYCPVCILEMKKWVKGDPRYSVQLDGKVYLFPGEEQKKMFLAKPTQYAPALGGDCVVCAVDGGARTAGSVHFSVIHDGRLYLFPGEKEKAAFMANPRKYDQADLALGGMCSVCRVEMNQEVPGKPEFATIYGGKRYLFPGAEQMKMFLANPGKYVQKP